MNENKSTETNETAESLELLKKLKTQVFESSDEKLALALGRPVSELEAWFSGAEQIDEDAQEKIHGLALMRLNSENKTNQ
ncbi:MAG: hypothetical protein H0T08_02000 [Acidobacteria bacterium]|nr:hypothetical protein [Acidobacteriota bacterium]